MERYGAMLCTDQNRPPVSRGIFWVYISLSLSSLVVRNVSHYVLHSQSTQTMYKHDFIGHLQMDILDTSSTEESRHDGKFDAGEPDLLIRPTYMLPAGVLSIKIAKRLAMPKSRTSVLLLPAEEG